MPIVLQAVTSALTTTLLAHGVKGPQMPALARGAALGVVQWVLTLKVLTQDVGVAGVGTGQFPLLFDTATFSANLVRAYSAQSLSGSAAPSEALGLADGLGLSFLSGVISTQHPSVGSGTGICRIVSIPATAFLLNGFASSGLLGPGVFNKALAISDALQKTFASMSFPVPIVGSPSITPSAGVGLGVVL